MLRQQGYTVTVEGWGSGHNSWRAHVAQNVRDGQYVHYQVILDTTFSNVTEVLDALKLISFTRISTSSTIYFSNSQMQWDF